VSSKKTILLLGSTGFLGSSVLNSLKSKNMMGWDILLSKSAPPGNSPVFTFLDSNSGPMKRFQFSELSNNSSQSFVVINCASSRNSGSKELSMHGNFEFPKKVLQSLLGTREPSIRWIQIETFWQYSKDSIPDENYVFWKNQFKNFLAETSKDKKFVVNSLTLSHLLGPFDNPNRFLPQLFSKIQRNAVVKVSSPNEVFCLTDVRDVAEHLVSTVDSEQLDQNMQNALFPSNHLTLREIVNGFIRVSGSQSQVEFNEVNEVFNPTLVFSEQPPILDSQHSILRSLDSTFSDIHQWLAELQRIGNLHQ